jgi:molybdopterin-containing oxidoreductase family iron-sulfur binding subunit
MSMTTHDDQDDLTPLRRQLAGKKGREFWRSLEELAETEEFQQFLHREFPPGATEWSDASGRRQFLKLMTASLAFAGLTACTVQPKEFLVPYVHPPENFTPGKRQFYATAMTMAGVANGLLVESHEGRPTKIEGNPDHPGSLGGTDIFAQSALLTLYDPDRSQTLTYIGDPRTWGEFLNEMRAALDAQGGKNGNGLRILTEAVTSPTMGAQIQTLQQMFPGAKWCQYDAVSSNGGRLGSQAAFGRMVNTIYRLENAEIILSLDSDFLTQGPGTLRYARDFANHRRLSGGRTEMSRFYAIESTLTPTGAKADHRLPARAAEIEALARAIAARVGLSAGEAPALGGAQESFVNALVKDLQAHRGRSVVIPGQFQSPAVHALAQAINQALGNVGTTVIHTEPIEVGPVDHVQSLRELVGEMYAGKVDLLIIFGGNPVYDAPADLSFVDALQKVPLRAHLSLYNDETSEYCQWHVPEAHFLEAWGDARAYDGTASIVQPLIQPLYGGRSPLELMAVLINQAGRSSYDLVRDYWKTQLGADFETAWRQSVHDGFVANTALPQIALTAGAGAIPPATPIAANDLEVVFRPDPSVYDGRFVNNGWLQELPKPITKLTWENAALLSAETAVKRLNLAPEGKSWEANGKVIEIESQGQRIAAPVWVVPGHADHSITLHLGYGRTRAGAVGTGIGYNAYRLRTTSTLNSAGGVKVTAAGQKMTLASTQEHFVIDGLEERQIIRTATLSAYQQDPTAPFHEHHKHEPGRDLSLYPYYEYEGYAWGMTIDMNACVGCNSCVVACQAENNIPVVGKEQVLNGREMQWLRIDTYFKGALGNPQTYFQPMLCQHCEQAPCEPVCPVNATVHDAEGLNVQVYNRCIGTRYCSNNCPYKVRRFNFLLYNDYQTPSLKLMRNPDVSVRSRGVMEKCTFCVQRIMRAKIGSEKEQRTVRDGEIVTACEGACPTRAITFGNLNDPASRVAQLKREPRNYGVIAELGTRPRTSYLASIRNPHPEIEPNAPSQETKHG